MAFGSNEERNHAFGNKDDNRKWLFFNCFKHLINIVKKTLGTMILFVHFMIKNLYICHVYLYISPIQIGDTQIRVEFDWLNLVLHRQRIKPLLYRLQLFKYLVPYKNLKTKNLSLLQLRLVRMIWIRSTLQIYWTILNQIFTFRKTKSALIAFLVNYSLLNPLLIFWKLAGKITLTFFLFLII